MLHAMLRVMIDRHAEMIDVVRAPLEAATEEAEEVVMETGGTQAVTEAEMEVGMDHAMEAVKEAQTRTQVIAATGTGREKSGTVVAEEGVVETGGLVVVAAEIETAVWTGTDEAAAEEIASGTMIVAACAETTVATTTMAAMEGANEETGMCAASGTTWLN